jgi:hypothetical protein
VLHDARSELLARIIGYVIFEEPAHQIAAAGERKADRERELITKGAVVHRRAVPGYVLATDRPVRRVLARCVARIVVL